MASEKEVTLNLGKRMDLLERDQELLLSNVAKIHEDNGKVHGDLEEIREVIESVDKFAISLQDNKIPSQKSPYEKSFIKSKKFLAFFFEESLLAGLLGYALKTQTITWPLAMFMTIGVAGMCALAINYIISQNAADKFMRGLEGISRHAGS